MRGTQQTRRRSRKRNVSQAHFANPLIRASSAQGREGEKNGSAANKNFNRNKLGFAEGFAFDKGERVVKKKKSPSKVVYM